MRPAFLLPTCGGCGHDNGGFPSGPVHEFFVSTGTGRRTLFCATLCEHCTEKAVEAVRIVVETEASQRTSLKPDTDEEIPT